MTALTTTFRPGRPVPLRSILGSLRRGAGDPTWRADATGLWRASQTPDGAVTTHFVTRPDGVDVAAWGPGAAWALSQVPRLLGGQDDPSGFDVHHAVLRDAARQHRDWRIGRTDRVMDALIPAIIEQRVTGKQAFGAYRRLVQRYGERAPGPRTDLLVPPAVSTWARIPSWDWLRAGVDAARSDTIMRAVRVAERLEEAASLPVADAWRRLRAVPGIGVWTAAETLQRAIGDPDAVSFGDYHVAKDVGFALTGAPVDDAGMEELLAPYAGHRYRVQFLVTASGLGAPRRAARLTLPTHLPTW